MRSQSRTFHLVEDAGAGVRCDEGGLFVGDAPLLERGGPEASPWRPRPLDALNAAVGDRYGLPVDLGAKLRGLAAVAGALNRGDVALAKLAALHLQLPDPPPPGGARLPDDDLIALVYRMQASGLLAKVFDESKHPRQPAGSPDHTGGQFAPAGNASAGAVAGTAKPADGQVAPYGAKSPVSPSPLASSLNRKPPPLSPQSQKLLAGLRAKLTDPTNQGVVTFDSREAALKDMGYYFSADITEFDDPKEQLERGDWLLYDPATGKWSYDRSQMRVGKTDDKVVTLKLTTPGLVQAYVSGNIVNVHIHPHTWLQKPGLWNGEQDEEKNRTFSPDDAHNFSAFSKANTGLPLHAAVIGSDGSISYADGGDKPEAYEDKRVIQIAPRGTIPMLNPN